MKTLFAPGCALNKYKPELISKISQFLLDLLFDEPTEGLYPPKTERRESYDP